MSRVWTSCAVDTRCGKCGHPIGFGHPVQTITPHPDRKLKTRFVRCRLCGDSTPPDDLPPPVVNRGVVLEPRKLLRLGQDALPLDYKALAGNDRDPGQEG